MRKRGQQKCKCGCGDYARFGNKFINGHNRRGKKPTAETRRKMSEGHIGYVVTEETKKKISVAGAGHLVSKETRKKISNIHKGKLVSEVTREKLSRSHRMNNIESAKNWDKYHPYMLHYQYVRLQNRVKNRDHCECVVCGKNKRIAAHHIVPVRVGCKSRLCDHESNLITLCDSCHGRIEHGKVLDLWKKFLSFAKNYLSQFGYEEMLLNDHI